MQIIFFAYAQTQDQYHYQECGVEECLIGYENNFCLYTLEECGKMIASFEISFYLTQRGINKVYTKKSGLLSVLAILVCMFVLVSACHYGSPVPPPVSDSQINDFSYACKKPKENAALSLNFSPYFTDNANPEQGTAVSESEIRSLLDAISPFCDTIRTFGVSGELNKLYKIAKEDYKMRIIAGCWIGAEYTEDQVDAELKILADIANEGYADILLVGSEGLFRNDYNAEQLIKWMDKLRGLLESQMPVGTSDTAGALLGEKKILEASDVICYTYYPYWNGTVIESSLNDFAEMYETMLSAANGKPLICGETGFPDGGDKVGSAVPNPENAARYFDEIYRFSRDKDFEVCYFEAVTEHWKEKYGKAESSFGLLDTELQPKPAYSEMIDDITDDVNGIYRFYVYADYLSKRNHYNDIAYMGNNNFGDDGSMKIMQDCTDNPKSRNTCIKITYTPKNSNHWAGMAWLSGDQRWRSPIDGVDVSLAKKLTFWARGSGGRVKFFIENSGKTQDSSYISLNEEWTQYTLSIPRDGEDIADISVGFGWAANSSDVSGKSMTFYLDDIMFVG